MDIHVSEGNISHEPNPHHHHSCHPEKEDIETSYQDRGRIKGFQLIGRIRPAQGGKWPERRTKPGIQHVCFLLKVRALARMACARIVLRDDNLSTVLAVPRRDPVAPPNLPRYTPVPNIVHPFIIDAFPIRRYYLCSAFFHSSDGLFSKRAYFDKPLLGKKRFDHGLTPVTVSYRVPVRFRLFKQARFLQVLDNFFTALKSVHTFVRTCQLVHSTVVIKNPYAFQAMCVTYLKVIEVMGRRNLQGTGTKLPIHIGIIDNRNRPVEHRQDDVKA
ncbi:hypothetical protein ES703_106825 [subsurface metagenome]